MSVSDMLRVQQLYQYDNRHFYASGTRRDQRAECRQEVAEALRVNGFCLVETRLDLRDEEIMNIADERRFALSSTAKHMMSESIEEGYVSGAHKEMFHFTSKSGAVQNPEYWYLPTAPGRTFQNVKTLGEVLFNGINAHTLHLLRDEYPFQQEAFPDTSDYFRWVNAVQHSSAHVLTSFHYKESNPDVLHLAAHVDKGILSICTNPKDLEICVRGEWIPLGHQPPGVVAVLTGFTLERATNGLFRAVRHRVRNDGRRLSRVMKLRLDPSLIMKPASIIACVPSSLIQDLAPSPDSVQMRELMQSFTAIHSSVNASNSPRPPPTDDEINNMVEDTVLGFFDMLPSNLVLSVFDWLRDIRDLYNLSLVSQSLNRIANSDVLCIPAAESSHVDWGGALDRIDRGVPSHVRATDCNTDSVPPGDLLESVSDRWLRVIGSELTETTRQSDTIAVVVRDQAGQQTWFTLKFNQRLQLLMNKYAQKKGTSVASLRFLLDGERIEGDNTCYGLEMEMNEQLDCILEQMGD